MAHTRILHVIWSAAMGGIGKVVLHLCIQQQKDPDLEVKVLIAKPGGELEDEFKASGIQVFHGRFKSGLNLNMAQYSFCIHLFQQVDIVHFHSFNPLIASAAVRSKSKIIYTEHGNFAFNRRLKFSERINRMVLKSFLNTHVRHLVCNSAFSCSTAVNFYGLSNTKKSVVYNGIPPSASFAPGNSSEFTICTIGRFVEVKRIDRLIAAFLLADLPDARLLITGGGPLKNNLEKRAAADPRIIFTGILPSSEIIAASHVCVLPSQNEAFGMVAIEAYQAGIPVIVFADGGGLTEIVSMCEPSCIVNDERALALQLKEIHADRSMVSDTSRVGARKAFAASFSIEKMAAQLKEIYHSI